jgi:two-component system sensor histidine kinase KdpD
MKLNRISFSMKLFENSFYALVAVAATTLLLLLIGLDKLGEAVIALLYMVPVVWSAARWGQGPGVAAALAAALFFDFCFTPPYYTFVVSRLDDWLILGIFLGVAIVVVDRIQTALSRAQNSEREAIFMYELSTTLASLQTQEAVANAVARFLQQRYLTSQVRVSIQPKGQPTEISATEPRESNKGTKPDITLPILSAWNLAGVIEIWRGDLELPSEESRLFQNFASQIGQALERIHLREIEASIMNVNKMKAARN